MAGILELTVTSPPQSYTEPISRDEALTFLALTQPDPGDASFLAQIDLFIQAAREQAELFQGRDLVAKQYDLVLDGFWDCGSSWNGSTIQLRRPLVSVDLVRYRDSDGNYTSLVDGAGYMVDLVRGLVMPTYGESWPSFTAWPSSAVLIRHTVGAAAVNAVLKVGMLTLISDWFNNRLPFGTGIDSAKGYPPRLQSLLSHGAIVSVF